MSLPTGVPLSSGTVRYSRPDEVYSTLRKTGSLKASTLPSPKFGGIADILGTAIAKLPIPSKALQNGFLYFSKEGEQAIYPLEAAVLAGRTQSAYKRDGWMEVQERIFEELAAAAIWLVGVKKLKNQFNNFYNRIRPQQKHLSPDIAWNRPWGKQTHVDLTAQELFSKNQTEINTLLRWKSSRWLFSVGLALAGVAYVVPTINQWKTRLLMNSIISRRKRSQEGDNVQFGDPSLLMPPTGSGFTNFSNSRVFNSPTFQAHPNPSPTTASPFNSPAIASAHPNFRFNQTLIPPAYPPMGLVPGSYPMQGNISGYVPAIGTQFPPIASHLANAPVKPSAPQFGGLPGGNLIQGLGHMVEQTPYGSILVVDAGIAGGRGYVASKRSAFETVEVLVRDIGSLYFYILSVPHLMKLFGKMLDNTFKSSMTLEPQVATAVNQALVNSLQGEAPSLNNVREALQGRATGDLLLPEGWLKNALRKARREELKSLFQMELQAYCNQYTAGQQLVKAIQEGPAEIRPEHIQTWLNDLQQARGTWSNVAPQERKNLAIALKQAFRHTAGLKLNKTENGQWELQGKRLEQHPDFEKTLSTLNPTEKAALIKRIGNAAEAGAVDQAHSMFRRSLNLVREYIPNTDKEAAQGLEAIADWLDQAQKRKLSLNGLLKEECQALADLLKPLEKKHNLSNTLSQLQNIDQLSTETLQALQQTLNGQSGRQAKHALQKLEQLRHLWSPKKPGLILKTSTEHLTAMAKRLSLYARSSDKQLVGDYVARLEQVLSGKEGRLFSLAVGEHNPDLSKAIRSLLQGGLYNDQALLRKAQMIVSQFEPDSKVFADPGKAKQMEEAIQHYGNALLQHLEKTGKPLTAESLLQGAKKFLNLNRYLHYGARSAAMLITMFSLGWVVPHVQTGITKRLTGKDSNPGIDSTAKSLGYGEYTHAKTKQNNPYWSPANASVNRSWAAASGYSL